MENNIALLTSGFIFMRFVELAVVSYVLYRVVWPDLRPVFLKTRYKYAHERARTAHSDKD